MSPQHPLAHAIDTLLTFIVARELLLEKYTPYVAAYRRRRVDFVRLRTDVRQVVGLFAPSSFRRAVRRVRVWRQLLSARRPPSVSFDTYAPIWGAERRSIVASERRSVRTLLRSVGATFGDFYRPYWLAAELVADDPRPAIL